jgi:hypothetical protein
MKEKHTHKMKRLKYKSGNTIFFCALPDCSFKTNVALALGKKSICWRCGNTFIMSEYSLRLAKPHCDNCHKPKGMTTEDFKETIANIQTSEISENFNSLSLSERLNRIIQPTRPTIVEKTEEAEDEI